MLKQLNKKGLFDPKNSETPLQDLGKKFDMTQKMKGDLAIFRFKNINNLENIELNGPILGQKLEGGHIVHNSNQGVEKMPKTDNHSQDIVHNSNQGVEKEPKTDNH